MSNPGTRDSAPAPVIALPSMIITGLIIWRLMAGIHELTGLGMDDLLHAAREHKSE